MTSVAELEGQIRHYQQTLARPDLPQGFRSQIRAARDRAQALLEMVETARDRGALVLHEYRHRERPTWAFVHPSTFEAGRWRWTYFDARGWNGHYDGFAGAEDAFVDMAGQGYVIPDPGRLQTFMGTDLWRMGNAIIDLRAREALAIRAGDWDLVQTLEAEIGALAERMAQTQGNPGDLSREFRRAEVNARELVRVLQREGHQALAENVRRCLVEEVQPLLARGQVQEALQRLLAVTEMAWAYRQQYKGREMGLRGNPRPPALAGGLGAGLDPRDFDPWQVRQGIAVEMEHTRDPEVALAIALDHLAEYRDYYTRLLAMERRGHD